MDRPPERITMASPSQKSPPPRVTPAPAPRVTPAPAKPPAAAKPSLPAGLQSGALDELRSAAGTFDYLRSTGDPMEFWEALRLARGRRGLKPTEGCAVEVPSEQEDVALREELAAIRVRFCDLVGEFRDFLKDTPKLPEPAERLEMALAFLMASSREHEFISLWLAEPDRHRAKAAERLRSLATITDAYREALKPWTMAT